MRKKSKSGVLTFGMVVRLDPVPYTRIYRDRSKYRRKDKHQKDFKGDE